MDATLPRAMLTHLAFRMMSTPIAALLRSNIIFIAETTLIVILVALLLYFRKRLKDEVLVWSEPYGKRGIAEKALQESQERLALVLEASDLGLWDRDIASGHTEHNARWAEMLGYKRDELEGSAESWRSRIHAEDRARVLEALQAHLDYETDRYEAEYRVIGRLGKHVWVHSVGRVSKRDDDGTPLRISGTNQDITARKQLEKEHLRAERELLQTQKLESLGVLAGGIAHDFNNLLMGIMGNASLLGFSLPDEHEGRHYLEDIDTSSRRAADLCRQLLTYSGRGNFNVETIDVNSLIMHSRSLLEASTGENATLQYALHPAPPHIDADALQVRQVIVNLVKNAAESLGDGRGDITITTGATDCDDAFLANAFVGEHAIPGHYAYIDISDTGLGMSPDTLTRAFEPFFSTKFAGRGLGLPAVQGIVHGHEGCIHIQSEARKGTCARVLFPMSESQAVSRTAPEHVSADTLLHGTVMVVDDETTVLAVAKQMVERLGLNVITAVDGRDALDRFKAFEGVIDCILLDLTMPHMGGEETFDALYRLDSNVQVLISSGYMEHNVARRFEGRQIAGFIQKPYDVDGLRDALHRLIGSAMRPR